MRALLAVAVVLTLTGCASLPMAGPVRIGPDLAPNSQVESFYYSPSSPNNDATQAEILNGFLAAGTGPQNDYAVAREFLSESIRSSWNPSQEVLIQRTSPTVTMGDEDTAQLVIDLAARIDADGRYQAFATGTKRTLDFSFVREAGQWRLSKAPDATVLIRPVFDVVFRNYSIFFLDRQRQHLVPELRWFPATPATGTRLANALLRGPSPWLRPAVVSAIPSGTRLSIDAVTVENGVALVDLTARALVATRVDRQLMKAQIQSTLSQLGNVQSVAISIERSPQEIPDPNPNLATSFQKSLVILGENGLERLSGLDNQFYSPATEYFEQNPTSQFALSRITQSLTTLTGAGVIRTDSTSPGEEVSLLDARAGIVDFEFDQQDYLWSLSRARGALVLATFSDGSQSEVSADWLANLSVRDFAISPEGARALVLVQGADRNRVLLSSIIRNQSGTPIGLAEPIEIAEEVSNPSAVAWASSNSVSILNSAFDFTNAYLVEIGGTSRIISAVSGTSQLISAGSPTLLYALTATGELYVFSGSTWSRLREGVLGFTSVF